MSEGMTLPADNRTGPNCGVTAIAIAAGVPFDTVFAMLARNNRRTYRWQGGTTHAARLQVLKQLGVPFMEIRVPRMRLERFVREATRHDRRYIVRVGKHVVVVRGGMVVDQGGPKPIAEHFARKRIVTHVIRLDA